MDELSTSVAIKGGPSQEDVIVVFQENMLENDTCIHTPTHTPTVTPIICIHTIYLYVGLSLSLSLSLTLSLYVFQKDI